MSGKYERYSQGLLGSNYRNPRKCVESEDITGNRRILGRILGKREATSQSNGFPGNMWNLSKLEPWSPREIGCAEHFAESLHSRFICFFSDFSRSFFSAAVSSTIRSFFACLVSPSPIAILITATQARISSSVFPEQIKLSPISKNKGPKRPIINLKDRIYNILALNIVDFIVVYDEKTPLNVLKSLKPNIMAKGDKDYVISDIIGREYADKTISVSTEEYYDPTRIINTVLENYNIKD